MTGYRIEYKQTMEERFDNDMNERARALIDTFGERIAYHGESGGTNLSTAESEQTFYIACDEVAAGEIVALLSAELGRDVKAVPSE